MIPSVDVKTYSPTTTYIGEALELRVKRPMAPSTVLLKLGMLLGTVVTECLRYLCDGAWSIKDGAKKMLSG
jgi:hypothetical protein